MESTRKSTQCTYAQLQKHEVRPGEYTPRNTNSLAAQIISKANQMVNPGDEIRIFSTQQVTHSRMYHTAGGYVLRYVDPTQERDGAALVYGGKLAEYHQLDETAFYLVSLRYGDKNVHGWAKQITRLNLTKPADLQLIWDIIGTA